jgi:pimeloyl-ACP methyl ester carboxylesterase
MVNQIYVEKLTPVNATQVYPILFIHGAGQTATNFMETPDGRPGWASFFLDHGYTVYLSDQPSRGCSPWNPSIGTITTTDTASIERLFTAVSSHNLWPQSRLHTQWPGTGKVGDVVFDAFYASQVQQQANDLISEAQNAKAYTALLDKINTSHVITHSQGGPYGWRVGDNRPHLVKSIVALEPGGPPFISRIIRSGPARPWGITELEVSYEPSAGFNATLLETTAIPAKDANHTKCIMQVEPAKILKKLAQVPVLMITAEASYHASYDYCTAMYLRQAGVEVEHAELGKKGIHGNGHMFFMEKNNVEIAELVLQWLQKR